MKVYKKTLVIVLLLICSCTCIFASGTKDNTKRNTNKDGKRMVITDFEDSSMIMRTYKGSESSIVVDYTKEKVHEGEQAVKLTANTKDWTGVEIEVPPETGKWSDMQTMHMWIFGSKSGTEIEVLVQDSQKEQFTYSIFDNHEGWEELALPFPGFHSRTDWQAEEAIVNEKIDFPITFMDFFSNHENKKVTLYFDLITVSDKAVEIKEEEKVVERITPANTLKDLAEYHGITFGAAASGQELNIKNIREVMARDFNSITAGNEMKCYVIRARQDEYKFDPADKFIQFAEENNMKVRGHTLVYHSSTPSWMKKREWTKNELMDFLKEYITTVVTRYKGKVYCWDVINEAFDSKGNFLTGDENIWYKVCGEEYIEKAFTWAHEADPDALLIINDYNVAELNAKSTGVYNYMKKLMAKGIPIHGFGAQLHVIEDSPPSYRRIYENMKRFAELGVEVHFTEMDVRIQGRITEKKLKHQAEIYTEIIKIAMAFDNITNVTTWGISDKHSWIPAFFPGYSGALLFDEYFNPKPAYYDVQVALIEGPTKMDYLVDLSKRHMVLPFKAEKCKTAPELDGEIGPGEWDSAVVYPFGYNQLNTDDLRQPDKSDLDGNWRILYEGNTIYGLVQRQDDQTVTNIDNDTWENDNLEIFFDIDNEFVQLRSIVRQNFEEHEYKGNQKAVWSRKGDILEFSIELPPAQLEGKIIGWNIALSDNDNKSIRDHQAYPVNGINKSFTGEHFGEIEFISKKQPGKRFGVEHLVMPFKANATLDIPEIDGKINPDEWSDGIVYPFTFNQLKSGQLTTPGAEDIYGDWRIVYSGNTVYGMVQQVDDKTITNMKNPRENDAVEVFFDVNDTFIHLTTVVGKDFEKHSYKGNQKAVWSNKGDILEFSIDLPANVLKKLIIGWNIALSDNDGTGKPDHLLYPVNGTNKSDKGKELAEIEFK